MKTVRLLALPVAILVAALPAAAAERGVTISKNGFVPADLSIAPGDTVTWTNSDSVVHQVAVDKTTCNLVVQPGARGSCTFSQVGVFNYRDPNERGNFRGTVRVDAALASLTLAASKQVVVFGSQVSLSGALAGQAAGETVTVFAQPYGATGFTAVGSTTTVSGGAYAYAVKPTIATTYQARWSGASSATVKVEVRPRVALAVVDAKRGVFRARVAQRRAPVGKVVDVQRRNAFGQWVTLRRVTLRSLGSATTAGARFAVKLPRGASTLRLLMPKAQAGAGYLQGISPARTVRR